MEEWIPSLDGHDAPRYMAIVEALERDISQGRLRVGTRLLPQRELANCLGVSVGTVSRAYAEAERRGLISGQVGRGTFVNAKAEQQPARASRDGGLIDLALNAPPETGEAEVLETLLEEIAGDGSVAGLSGYLPHQGLAEHRAAVADWLGQIGYPVPPDRVFITHGAQHGLFLAVSLVATSGDTVLTEGLTYAGVLALSSFCGYRLHGVDMDDHGLLPEALDAAFSQTGARVLYTMPTYQTPTGRTMPQSRREAIARVVKKHDAFLIEDDAYGFLPSTPLRPISDLIPERSFYAMSFAKCLAPGLRIGALVPPPLFRDRCINAFRATGWMAAPVMAEVVSRAIRGGHLSDQVSRKRAESLKRQEAARSRLGEWLSPASMTGGFHVWLQLPPGRTLDAVIAQSYSAGIRLAAPSAIGARNDNQPSGVRLCLGGASDIAQLETALREIGRILSSVEEISLV